MRDEDQLPVRTQEACRDLTATSERVAAYAAASISPNTRKAYRSDWAAFAAWCAERNLSPLPAQPETIALFLADQAEQGLKTSTIGRRMASLSQAHELAGHPSPTRDRRVRKVWQGICREKGCSVQKKRALALTDLKAIVAGCEDDLMGKRDKALLLLAFSGAMRRSELIGLDVEDVQVEGDNGLRVHIRRSKTDQTGAGREIGIPVGKNATTCPVLAFRAYLNAAQLTAGPVFRPLNRWGSLRQGRLTSQSVAYILKRRIKALGIDPNVYGAHSLRSGFVTSAARAGVPEHAIARQTGHRSVAVLRGYVQAATIFSDNPASALDL